MSEWRLKYEGIPDTTTQISKDELESLVEDLLSEWEDTEYYSDINSGGDGNYYDYEEENEIKKRKEMILAKFT